MQQHPTDSRLANLGANAIYRTFSAYQISFQEITRRAKSRFENRDWHSLRADATERLGLYGDSVNAIVTQIRELFGERVQDKLLWTSLKAV